MSKWQPIETAPKDGTYILAYPGLLAIPLVIAWDTEFGYWRIPPTAKEAIYRPRFWQPLPQPPEATE